MIVLCLVPIVVESSQPFLHSFKRRNMKLLSIKTIAVLAMLSLTNLVIGSAHGTDNGGPEKLEETAKISQKCAVILLATGSAFGGTAAHVISPIILSYLGFTSVGVQAGSIASYWQSTMPIVKVGSMFAKLQSIAMTGAGSSTTVKVSALGGAAVAWRLHSMCELIDDVEPESNAGTALAMLVAAEVWLSSASQYAWEFVSKTVLMPSEETRQRMKESVDSANSFVSEKMPRESTQQRMKEIAKERSIKAWSYAQSAWTFMTTEDNRGDSKFGDEM